MRFQIKPLFCQVIQSYNAIVAKKAELNVLQDAAKKKSTTRDPFWHVKNFSMTTHDHNLHI